MVALTRRNACISLCIFITFCGIYFWVIAQNDAMDDEVFIFDYGPFDTRQPFIDLNDLDNYVHNDTVDTNFVRRQAIRNAVLHAWAGYEAFAFGHDELRPALNLSTDEYGGFGVSLFEWLDTFIIMDLEEPYQKARSHVLNVTFDKDYDASFAEFTLKYIGGLLGAHEFTRDKALLAKAVELGDILMKAFQSEVGLPYSIVNLKTHQGSNRSNYNRTFILSEVGSFQLEFHHLSARTKKPNYSRMVKQVNEVFLEKILVRDGLYPIFIDEEGNFASDLVTYGTYGDVFYDYLLKQYLVTNRTNQNLRELYLDAMEGLLDFLMEKSHPSGFDFIGELHRNTMKFIPEMDHIACFVPGMLALGAEGDLEELHMSMAEKLIQTCYQLYSSNAFKLSPDRVVFNLEATTISDFEPIIPEYMLRPETAESIFILYRKTHNETYRDWAWEIFQAIEKNCKTSSGYSSIILEDIDPKKRAAGFTDEMPSYFLSKTLKYLFLTFSDDDILPIDAYVFNNQGHPVRVLKPSKGQ